MIEGMDARDGSRYIYLGSRGICQHDTATPSILSPNVQLRVANGKVSICQFARISCCVASKARPAMTKILRAS